jgi:hypothetical protein
MQASPCKKCGEPIFLVHPDAGDCALGLVALKASAVLAVWSERKRIPVRLIVTGFYNDGGEWRPFGGIRARKNDRQKVVVHEEHECPKEGNP